MQKRIIIVLLFLVPTLVLAGIVLLRLDRQGVASDQTYIERVELAAPGTRIGLPDTAGPGDPALPLVVIDPGHGGFDSGARGEEIFEKAITLGLAQTLRDTLVETGAIRVALTRDEDRFISLEERVDIARRLGADLFLSIHADSAGESGEVTGASIYILSEEASSAEAARFADAENRADTIGGVDIASHDDTVDAILFELSQRRARDQAAQFAALIEREGQGLLAFHPLPRRSASLVVLRAPDMPSVLYEAGFVSNPEEARALSSPDGQARFAAAMSSAIRVFFIRNPPDRSSANRATSGADDAT